MDQLDQEKKAIETIDNALGNLPDSSDVLFALNKNAKEAAITLGVLLYSQTDTVKLAAARDILDRTGYKPIERKDITSGGKAIEPVGLSDEQLMDVINGFLKRTAINVPGREVKPDEGVVSPGP